MMTHVMEAPILSHPALVLKNDKINIKKERYMFKHNLQNRGITQDNWSVMHRTTVTSIYKLNIIF